MVRISDLVSPLLDQYLESKTAMLELDFGDDDEPHEGRYLFSRGTDHRALTISQWTAAIKAAFGRHSPNAEAPPPKLLRSSFITFLRSSERAPEVLKSAAGVMKHAVNTSASDVYDKAVHEKLLSASFKFCEDYSRQVAAEVEAGTSSGTHGGGKAKAKAKGKAKGKASKSVGGTAKVGVGKGKERVPQRHGAGSKPQTTPSKPAAAKAGRPQTPAKAKAKAGRKLAPPPPTPSEAAALLGKAVRKEFGGEWYDGRVAAFVAPFLRLEFADGDVEEVGLDEARVLVSGVHVGRRVRYHFGSAGWVAGEVLAKYRRGLGLISECAEEAEDQTSTAMAWQVAFDDGETLCVDLSLERCGHLPKAGTWQLEPPQRN